MAQQIINSALLAAIFTGFKTLFQKTLTNTKTYWQDFASFVQSETEAELYGWAEGLPKMREWIGERHIHSLKAQAVTVINRLFELTLGVPRTKIEDDKLGTFSLTVSEMARSAKVLADELVFEKINGAFAALAYDGQYFFDTDHPRSSGGVQSNKMTAALSADAYAEARKMLMQITDDQGKSMGNGTKLVLLVPPALEKMARQILNADIISNTSNVYKGTAELIVCPLLTSDTAWFLLEVSHEIRAFVYQERLAAEFEAKTDDGTSDHTFIHDEYLYGVRARGAGAYGLWQFAVGSTGV